MTCDVRPPQPTLREALPIWLRIGLTSFGGPAGQIALMHKVLVDEKKWLDERTYLWALNFCTLLPGPEAMQLATYCGWRMHGVRGGLSAGLLFVLPGAIVILALAMLYGAFGSVALIGAVFIGIKAAVLAIVIEALLKISGRALRDRHAYGIAVASFVLIFFFRMPFPLIVLGAAVYGYLRGAADVVRSDADQSSAAAGYRVSPSQTVATIAVWSAIWLLPLILLALVVGPEHVLAKLALLFSGLAVVSFGGAYAVLAYMTQEAVQTHGWLTTGDMLNALGLAETTPGPLILVTEFVGYLAAYRSAAGSVAVGMMGALVTLWATFAPCFLYIFAGAPYIERLKNAPRLGSALSAITAAIVGVIANLSVWFVLHVIFRKVSDVDLGVLRISVPEVASIDWVALGIAAVAAVMLFYARVGVIATLAGCALLGLLAHWLL